MSSSVGAAGRRRRHVVSTRNSWSCCGASAASTVESFIFSLHPNWCIMGQNTCFGIAASNWGCSADELSLSWKKWPGRNNKTWTLFITPPPGESVWRRPLRVCCSLSVLRRPLESALQQRIIPSVSLCSSRLLRKTSASNFLAGGGENELEQRGRGEDWGGVAPPALLGVPGDSTNTPEGKLMCHPGAWTVSHDGAFTNPSEVSTRRPGYLFHGGRSTPSPEVPPVPTQRLENTVALGSLSSFWMFFGGREVSATVAATGSFNCGRPALSASCQSGHFQWFNDGERCGAAPVFCITL